MATSISESGSSDSEFETYDQCLANKGEMIENELHSDMDEVQWELTYASGNSVNFVKYLSERKLNKWKWASIDVAIIGNAGAGKSTFINAYRGIKGDEEDAAPTGATETTERPTSYRSRENPKLILWDLPGLGTPNHPKETYLQEIEFDKYDIFILMTHLRFTTNDAWIAKEIENRRKVLFFVRTKVWNDVENTNKTQGKERSPKDIIEDIRKECETKLNLPKERIYLIDSLKPDECLLDFGRLKEDMAQRLPLEKREALLHAIGTGSKKLIKMHEKILRRKIKWRAIWAGYGGLVPVPGVFLLINSTILSELKDLFAQRLDLTLNIQYVQNLKESGVSDKTISEVENIMARC